MKRSFISVLFLALTASACSEETLVEGQAITIALGGTRTLLAPTTKEADIFRQIVRKDIEAIGSYEAGEWYAPALAVGEYKKLLTKFTKNGLFKTVTTPTKAKVIKVDHEDEVVAPNVYEIEIEEGPLKGKRFGYSFGYDRGFVPYFEEGYIYFPNKSGVAEPVTLAFDRSFAKIYAEAKDNGDTDTVSNLKKLGRIWTVPIGSTGQIIEKDGNIIDARFEILSGPFKGRKGWGHSFDIGRKPMVAKSPTNKK